MLKKMILLVVTLMSVSCLSIDEPGMGTSPENIKQARKELWNKYMEKVRNDPVRKKEHNQSGRDAG